MADTGAIRAGQAYVEFSARRGPLDRALKDMENRFRAWGASMRAVGANMVGIGITLAAPFAYAIKAASDANETASKFTQVFGAQAAAAEGFVNDLAKAVGRSRSEIKEGTSAFQAMFTGMDFDPGKARQMSQALQELSIDFASFHNTSDADAQEAFLSAISGQVRPLMRYGVNLHEVAIEQELLTNATIRAAGANEEQQKVLARLAIIQRSMTQQAAVGDAVRTADQFANRMRALKSSAMEAAVAVGETLLPPLAALAGQLKNGLFAAAEFVREHREIVKVAALAVVGLTGLGVALVGLGLAATVAGFALGRLRGLGFWLGDLAAVALALAGMNTQFRAVAAGAGVSSTGILGWLERNDQAIKSALHFAAALGSVAAVLHAGRGLGSFGKALGGVAAVGLAVGAVFSPGLRGRIAEFANPSTWNVAAIIGFATALRVVGFVLPLVRSGVLGLAIAVRGIKTAALLAVVGLRMLKVALLALKALSIAGAFVSVFGSLASVAGTAVAAIGSALALLITPIGLITAALVGGGAAWLYYSGAGGRALSTIGRAAGEARGVVGAAFDGIGAVATRTWAGVLREGRSAWTGVVNALKVGDFQLALEIISTAARLIWLEFVEDLKEEWGRFIAHVQANTPSIVTTWNTTTSGISSAWNFCIDDLTSRLQVFKNVFDAIVATIRATFGLMTDFITGRWAGAIDRMQSRLVPLRTAAENMRSTLTAGEGSGTSRVLRNAANFVLFPGAGSLLSGLVGGGSGEGETPEAPASPEPAPVPEPRAAGGGVPMARLAAFAASPLLAMTGFAREAGAHEAPEDHHGAADRAMTPAQRFFTGLGLFRPPAPESPPAAAPAAEPAPPGPAAPPAEPAPAAAAALPAAAAAAAPPADMRAFEVAIAAVAGVAIDGLHAEARVAEEKLAGAGREWAARDIAAPVMSEAPAAPAARPTPPPATPEVAALRARQAADQEAARRNLEAFRERRGREEAAEQTRQAAGRQAYERRVQEMRREAADAAARGPVARPSPEAAAAVQRDREGAAEFFAARRAGERPGPRRPAPAAAPAAPGPADDSRFLPAESLERELARGRGAGMAEGPLQALTDALRNSRTVEGVNVAEVTREVSGALEAVRAAVAGRPVAPAAGPAPAAVPAAPGPAVAAAVPVPMPAAAPAVPPAPPRELPAAVADELTRAAEATAAAAAALSRAAAKEDAAARTKTAGPAAPSSATGAELPGVLGALAAGAAAGFGAAPAGPAPAPTTAEGAAAAIPGILGVLARGAVAGAGSEPGAAVAPAPSPAATREPDFSGLAALLGVTDPAAERARADAARAAGMVAGAAGGIAPVAAAAPPPGAPGVGGAPGAPAAPGPAGPARLLDLSGALAVAQREIGEALNRGPLGAFLTTANERMTRGPVAPGRTPEITRLRQQRRDQDDQAQLQVLAHAAVDGLTNGIEAVRNLATSTTGGPQGPSSGQPAATAGTFSAAAVSGMQGGSGMTGEQQRGQAVQRIQEDQLRELRAQAAARRELLEAVRALGREFARGGLI